MIFFEMLKLVLFSSVRVICCDITLHVCLAGCGIWIIILSMLTTQWNELYIYCIDQYQNIPFSSLISSTLLHISLVSYLDPAPRNN